MAMLRKWAAKWQAVQRGRVDSCHKSLKVVQHGPAPAAINCWTVHVHGSTSNTASRANSDGNRCSHQHLLYKLVIPSSSLFCCSIPSIQLRATPVLVGMPFPHASRCNSLDAMNSLPLSALEM